MNSLSLSINEIKEPGVTHLIELSELRASQPKGDTLLSGNMALLQGVKVTLTAVAGHVQTTLGALMDLKEASVLKIDRSVDDPIDIMVEGKVIARGQLVAIDDNFGVRVTQIAAAQ